MIVAGFGFRSGVSPNSLRDALERVDCAQAPQAFATLKDKASELMPLAEDFGLKVIAIGEEAASAQRTPTRSDASLKHKRIASVAEATALAAAGTNARLLVRRRLSGDRMATCAIAIGDG